VRRRKRREGGKKADLGGEGARGRGGRRRKGGKGGR